MIYMYKYLKIIISCGLHVECIVSSSSILAAAVFSSPRCRKGWDGPICKHMYTYYIYKYIYIYTSIMCVYVQYIYMHLHTVFHIYVYIHVYTYTYINRYINI